jgi:sulfonate transport system substrate-binding protein
MWPRNFTRTALACLIAALMSVVAHAQSTKVFTVRVASSGVCVCHAPIYVGIAKGIFEKHGLSIVPIQTPSGFQSLSMVTVGGAEVGDSAIAPAGAAAQQGIENTAVLIANGDATGTEETDKYFAIVARGDRGIRAGRIKDLRGKKIGVATGTIAHQYLVAALVANGMDANAVSIQNVSPPDLPTVLQSGSVDAIVGWEPAPLLALKLVKGAVEVYRGGNYVNYIFMRWMNPSFIKEHPDVAQHFVDAFAEAAYYTRRNRGEAASIVASALKMEPDMVNTMLGELNFDMRYTKASQDGIDQALDFARKFGGFQGDYDFRKHYDADLTRITMKAHPEYFSDLPPIK